jgi:hypothetical protein
MAPSGGGRASVDGAYGAGGPYRTAHEGADAAADVTTRASPHRDALLLPALSGAGCQVRVRGGVPVACARCRVGVEPAAPC